MLNGDLVRKYGYFDPDSVELLLNKFSTQRWKNISERDDMTMVGLISMQLLHHHFIDKGMDDHQPA